MKEKLYTIPVNDAFASSCECPICTMYKTLEDNSIEYTMGPSYMEDDVRSETDRLGFCDKHIKQVYHMDNRLGMAWVMKTHFDKTIDDVGKLQKKELPRQSPCLKRIPKKVLCCHIFTHSTAHASYARECRMSLCGILILYLCCGRARAISAKNTRTATAFATGTTRFL